MKPRGFKSIGSISLSALLIASTIVIFNNNAYASEQAPVNSSSSGEVGAASGSNRFVVWSDSAGEGPGDIYFRRSTDNGATWKPSVNLSNNPGLSDVPMITVSGSKVYVVWRQYSADFTSQDIFFRRSTDDGVTWGSKLKITGGLNNCGGVCFVSQVSASGSNVYVLWESGYTAPGEIYLRRSSDSGVTWKTIINLSSNAGPSYDPHLAVSGSNVYVVWTQANAAQTSIDILSRRSTDSGATWKSKVNISNNGLVNGGPNIAVSGANVYIVWGDCRPPAEDPGAAPECEIFSRRSTDNGSTWKSEQNISNTPTEDSFNPQVAAVGSNVYVAWNDNVVEEDKSEDGDIFIRRSTNGGSSWDSVINVGHQHNNGCGFNIQLAASGSAVYLLWTVGACSSAGQNIFFSRSTDSGASWSPPDDMSDIFIRPSLGAQLAVTGSTVFIVCAENMSGPGFDIFFARSTNSGGTWNSAINLSSNSGRSDSPQIGV